MAVDVCCIFFSALLASFIWVCVSCTEGMTSVFVTKYLQPSVPPMWVTFVLWFLWGNCRSPTQSTLPISRCSWFLNTCGSAFHVGEASRESIPPQEVGIGDCLREEAGDEPWTRTCHRLLFLPLLSLLFFHHPHFLKISYKKLSNYFGFVYSLFLANFMQSEPGTMGRKVVLSFR